MCFFNCKVYNNLNKYMYTNTNTSNTNSNTSTSAQHINTLISIWLIDDHLYSAILWSTVLSRLTALACGSTWVTRGRQKREIIYILSLHCHHQNDSCIKMGSGESHFNVSLTVGGKVTRQCPQSTTLEGEPKRIRTEVPLLTSLTSYR